MTDEQIGEQMVVADAKLREALTRLLRDDGVGVLAAGLALAGPASPPNSPWTSRSAKGWATPMWPWSR